MNQWGRIIEPVSKEMELASYGNSLRLTLDSEIQYFAETALARRIEELKAVGGALVAMNPRTGDVLAMASYPSFTPDDPGTRQPEAMQNRAVEHVVEPGSVMKIFTYATALENRLVAPQEIIDCEGGPYCFREGRSQRVVTDFHPMGVVTALEAFADSSNIAAVKVGLRIDPAAFHAKIRELRLTENAGLRLPGEAMGHLTDRDQWSFLTRTSVPFGYELSVNAVQMAACVGAIANGGEKMAPRLAQEIIAPTGETVESFEPQSQGRVFSPETCRTMVQMMEAVVAEGTGKDAAVEGYRVAGKTGTTRKPSKEGEDRKYIGSFVGFLPASDPQLVVYCWIDEPSPANDDYTGGRAAAPVFRQVAEQAVRILGIPPDKPGEAPAAPAAAPEDIAMEGDPGDSVVEQAKEKESEARPDEIAETRADTKADRAEGGMPDLTGMSMREARSALDAFRRAPDGVELKVSFYGKGCVFDQNPPPHAAVQTGEECSIYFAPREQGDEEESPDQDSSVAAAAALH
ncbi:MAG: penicillin-binding transpeptidase domain-containing protein [Candidatus Sumerlaeota bacterium]|nr:penicillin-binding transpeptidase domain-containing protein [Candidatus Sumerlaeota bacterium]